MSSWHRVLPLAAAKLSESQSLGVVGRGGGGGQLVRNHLVIILCIHKRLSRFSWRSSSGGLSGNRLLLSWWWEGHWNRRRRPSRAAFVQGFLSASSRAWSGALLHCLMELRGRDPTPNAWSSCILMRSVVLHLLLFSVSFLSLLGSQCDRTALHPRLP